MSALEKVGVVHLARRSMPSLSGGERQLVLVARALAQLTAYSSNYLDGRLLLLDEPTAHLDLHNKARIVEILRHLRDQGLTILMTSHEPEVVLAIADAVLLMGVERVQFGASDDVLTGEGLSRTFGIPIRVVELEGRKRVVWI